ncbi:MAG TPA: patatin-like phospholipase family protein [Casimicrobium huifangae]|nr:patatin-like phospholipase family protein [Casimicrobium huifangae]
MALGTIIYSGLMQEGGDRRALVLMGGGARTAYQVGVLKAMAALLQQTGAEAAQGFPFQVLVGTSAGAINATSLAGYAELGLQAFTELGRFWEIVRSADVYRINETSANAWFGGSNKYLAAINLTRGALAHGAILDNTPLIATLRKAISFDGIERALQQNVLASVAVTASSYSSGVHWTFCHADDDSATPPWNRPGRRAEFQQITVDHLMASSAIPIVFPATALTVDGQPEYFGDGSMRQISPLSPAMHLGAHRIMVIGVGQPKRSGLGRDAPTQERPGLSAVASHAMASVFHDTLQADVEQAQRVTETLKRLPPEVAAVLPYRPVQVFAMQPSQSLDALALQHAAELPLATRQSLGGLISGSGGASLASYLLFEPGFIDALMRLGQRDAYARAAEIIEFFR